MKSPSASSVDRQNDDLGDLRDIPEPFAQDHDVANGNGLGLSLNIAQKAASASDLDDSDTDSMTAVCEH